MASRKRLTNEDVCALVRKARDAWQDHRLLCFANKIVSGTSLSSDQDRLVNANRNPYPSLPFEITGSDMTAIAEIRQFREPDLDGQTWSPWKKVLYALLWKDGKLESIKRILDGLEHALDQSTEAPLSETVVYHYFGRHLIDRLNEPLLDQHSVRAQRLITNQNSALVDEIRKADTPTQEQAVAYREWFRQVLKNEGINEYKDARIVDSYLYALGKTVKHRQPTAHALGATQSTT